MLRMAVVMLIQPVFGREMFEWTQNKHGLLLIAVQSVRVISHEALTVAVQHVQRTKNLLNMRRCCPGGQCIKNVEDYIEHLIAEPLVD